MNAPKFAINPAWRSDPELFEKFMREADVFGHRMCEDAKVAARDRAREEAIEEFLFSNLAPSMAMQREVFRVAKKQFFKESR